MKKHLSMWQWLLILVLAWCLAACGPNYHLRRAKHHEAKAIAKGAIVKVDTVFIEKQVIVPEVKTDTVFESKEGDTVFISKERLKIKYVNLPGDSVFIEGECEPDTLMVEVPITITKEIKAPITWRDWLPWVLLLIAVGYFINSIRRKR